MGDFYNTSHNICTMNVYEWTPWMRPVRVTKKQLKQIQKNMQKAGKIVNKFKEIEELEKQMAEEELKKLDTL